MKELALRLLLFSTSVAFAFFLVEMFLKFDDRQPDLRGFHHRVTLNDNVYGFLESVEAVDNPDGAALILGGIVVRAGDTIFDGSLRRRLDGMRRQLLGTQLRSSGAGAPS